MNTAKVRSDCRYNDEEYSKISPFKSKFISATKEERIGIFKNDICVKLFNYWEDMGKVFNAEENKALTKVCPRNICLNLFNFKLINLGTCQMVCE